MTDVSIRAEHLSKRYRIGLKTEMHHTLGGAVASFLTQPITRFRRLRRLAHFSENGRDPEDVIWALKDVSFEVKTGEVVGIIGRNGAGKSTLLKVLSRITEPTEGYARITGQLGSLLEVGTGFHPELTGRENVYLNGAVLGMRRKEIDLKFDEIVDFSGVEKFIDTPVKRYSSGMEVRLAFAVAAHMEPEILIVDEVLAVGDAAFQKKCLGKMENIGKEGRTVVFVSHNLDAISTLTTRTILLDFGRVISDSDTNSALRHYRSLWNNATSGPEYVNPNKSTGLTRARVLTSEPNQVHRFGEELIFEFELALEKKPGTADFSFEVVDEGLRPVMTPFFIDAKREWSSADHVRLRCVVPRPRLYMGRYSVNTYLGDRSSLNRYEILSGVFDFEVTMEGIPSEGDGGWRPGLCAYVEEVDWRVI